MLRIPQSPSITGTSTSDCLVSYLGHSLGGVLPLSRGAVGVFYSPRRLGKKTNRVEITRKQNWEEKHFYGRFKQLTSDISHEKMWTWLRKGNLKTETESFLLATQNYAIRTNHIKASIDKTQQNSKCRLCGDKDETINYIINEYSKLA